MLSVLSLRLALACDGCCFHCCFECGADLRVRKLAKNGLFPFFFLLVKLNIELN